MPCKGCQLSVCTESEKQYILGLWGSMSRLLRILYEKDCKKFWLRVYVKIGDAELAKDIVHDTMARVLIQIRSHPDRFDPMTEAELLAYVYRSLENAIIDFYRKRDTEKRKLQEYMEACVVEQTGRHALEDCVIEKEECRNILRFCMTELREEELLLLRDVYYYELPYRILAAEHGVSEFALRQRVSRIRKRLRKAKEKLK